MLQIQQRSHQPDRQTRPPGGAYASIHNLHIRTEQVFRLNTRATSISVRQARRHRRLDCRPRHALRKHRQPAAKIDHLIQTAAEEIVSDQSSKPSFKKIQKLSGSESDYVCKVLDSEFDFDLPIMALIFNFLSINLAYRCRPHKYSIYATRIVLAKP